MILKQVRVRYDSYEAGQIRGPESLVVVEDASLSRVSIKNGRALV